mmetsp:Transcript_18472/g.62912  ORF Transcript_18472/g.62912 Transcript_18472/m.62912 type:complete len:285 (+) Transcript_18472:1033-1887(+)
MSWSLMWEYHAPSGLKGSGAEGSAEVKNALSMGFWRLTTRLSRPVARRSVWTSAPPRAAGTGATKRVAPRPSNRARSWRSVPWRALLGWFTFKLAQRRGVFFGVLFCGVGLFSFAGEAAGGSAVGAGLAPPSGPAAVVGTFPTRRASSDLDEFERPSGETPSLIAACRRLPGVSWRPSARFSAAAGRRWWPWKSMLPAVRAFAWDGSCSFVGVWDTCKSHGGHWLCQVHSTSAATRSCSSASTLRSDIPAGAPGCSCGTRRHRPSVIRSQQPWRGPQAPSGALP